MSSANSKDIPMTLTSFSMKCVGLWLAGNSLEEKCRSFALCYTTFTIIFSVWVQTMDFYYSWGDFGTCVYIGCNTLCLLMALFKTLILYVHRKGFLSLVTFVQEKFWNSSYDSKEEVILRSWTRRCSNLVCFFTFFIICAIMSYAIRPLLGNIGKNETERVLPFNIWLDLPLHKTPYFEITFVLQVVSLFQIGICYFCFDNFLCIMSLYVAGLFNVLQHRFSNMNIFKNEEKHDGVSVTPSPHFVEAYYASFKSYIQQHQSLIEYCDELEKVYNIIVLMQVLTFSLLICLVGYQVLLADSSSTMRITFILLLVGTMCQLLMFTYSCDCLIQESTNVATAIYSGPWLYIPFNNNRGKMLRQDLLIVLMRARRACCLTALRFFPVSLETYTRILSTAMSYFTLLRQGSVE